MFVITGNSSFTDLLHWHNNVGAYPCMYSGKDAADYDLRQFEAAYPHLKGQYSVIEVTLTRK